MLSAENIDRAGPDQVTVFLRDARIKRVVALIFEHDAAFERGAMLAVVVRQPEYADLALDAAIRENEIFAPDIGDPDVGFDERRVQRERTGVRLGEPCIEAAESAGGERRPFELAGRSLVELLVEIPEIDRPHFLEPVAGQLARAVPYGLPAPAAVFGAFPYHAYAPAEGLIGVRPPCSERHEPVADLDTLDRRRRYRVQPEGH